MEYSILSAKVLVTIILWLTVSCIFIYMGVRTDIANNPYEYDDGDTGFWRVVLIAIASSVLSLIGSAYLVWCL